MLHATRNYNATISTLVNWKIVKRTLFFTVSANVLAEDKTRFLARYKRRHGFEAGGY